MSASCQGTCRVISSGSVTDEQRNVMFDMYETSYKGAGQSLWFKSAEDLFKYPCAFVIHEVKDHILCYIMFQKRKIANKISLLSHNGTTQGKRRVMELVSDLLKTKGWILEASGAVSWVLRKRETPIIESERNINRLLNIDHDERIIINNKFNINDKTTQYYYHQYYKDGIIQFENEETLFGVSGCKFNNDNCTRYCVDVDKKGYNVESKK